MEDERIQAVQKCLQCGKDFLKRRDWQIFCNVTCSTKYHSNLTKKGRELAKAAQDGVVQMEHRDRVVKKCKRCGADYLQREDWQEFCGNECALEDKLEREKQNEGKKGGSLAARRLPGGETA